MTTPPPAPHPGDLERPAACDAVAFVRDREFPVAHFFMPYAMTHGSVRGFF